MNFSGGVLAFVGAAAFASCSGDGGGARDPGVGGRAGSAAVGGRAGSAGLAAAGGNAAGAGSFPGLVPFDPVWTKTTPPDWTPYRIPATPRDGCVYVNPDGVDRLVDSVRAQRASSRQATGSSS